MVFRRRNGFSILFNFAFCPKLDAQYCSTDWTIIYSLFSASIAMSVAESAIGRMRVCVWPFAAGKIDCLCKWKHQRNYKFHISIVSTDTYFKFHFRIGWCIFERCNRCRTQLFLLARFACACLFVHFCSLMLFPFGIFAALVFRSVVNSAFSQQFGVLLSVSVCVWCGGCCMSEWVYGVSECVAVRRAWFIVEYLTISLTYIKRDTTSNSCHHFWLICKYN